MDSIGAFPDGEWDSITRMLITDQGIDYAPPLLGQYQFSQDHDDNFVISPTYTSPAGEIESWFSSLEGLNSSFQYIFQETSLGSSTSHVYVPSSSYYYNNDHITNNGYMSNDLYMTDENSSSFALAFPHTSIEWQLKRKLDAPDLNTEGNANSETPKKKICGSTVIQKSPQPKKTGKDEEESNVVQERPSSSSCSSEDEPEMSSLPSTRASRGLATNPQSLYARKRRERINERLKILQNLVPNGTKVDISTMLEEAVEYVKFLQIQIKLLSCDKKWMYAPIAYNGMDIGLVGRMHPTSP